jgi:hypothetical protein
MQFVRNTSYGRWALNPPRVMTAICSHSNSSTARPPFEVSNTAYIAYNEDTTRTADKPLGSRSASINVRITKQLLTLPATDQRTPTNQMPVLPFVAFVVVLLVGLGFVVYRVRHVGSA